MDYIKLFIGISGNNKYARWYLKMMQNALHREPPLGGERHHIIPRSFGLGGATAKSNVVALTGREHFIAHMLLHKSLTDAVLKKKALFAVFQMTTRMSVSSRVAGAARNAMAGAVKELWLDPIYRGKQADAAKTKYASSEYRYERSNYAKRQMGDPAQRQAAIKTLAEAHSRIDHSSSEWVGRSIRSEASVQKAKSAHQSESFRAKRSAHELAKSTDERKLLAMTGAKALRDKFQDDDAYRSYLSNRIKGRVKIANMETKTVKVVPPGELGSGWVLYKTLSSEQKLALKAVK